MKLERTKELHYQALTTAAEMIRGQFETGATWEETGFDSFEDQQSYVKECHKIAKTLEARAERYKALHKLYRTKKLTILTFK